MLPAIGSAILFNIDASSGGTDVIAMILKKYTSMNIGSALMAADVAAVGLSFAMYGPSTGLFSVMGLVAKSMVVDNVIENMNLCKCFNIVCELSLIHISEPTRRTPISYAVFCLKKKKKKKRKTTSAR